MKSLLLKFIARLALLGDAMRVFRTTDYYGAKSSGRNDAINRAGLRETEPGGQQVNYFKDATVSMTMANTEVLRFGPFPANSVIIASSMRIIGDGTTNIGDDINIGYEPVQSTDGTAVESAYIDALNISVASKTAAPFMTDFDVEVQPAFQYWVTLTMVDASGAVAGTIALECLVRHLN